MNHLDLTSLPWTLSRADALADSIPAVVPGCVHTALLRAGRIEDPFAVGAEERLNWIGLAEWTYETEFVADASLLAQEHIELFADNLDTLVTLTLNGQEIGRADNQFREWRWDVRAYLQPGVNRLALRFESADRYLEQRSAEPVLRDGIDVRLRQLAENLVRGA
jgi:beta-mannosidase